MITVLLSTEMSSSITITALFMIFCGFASSSQEDIALLPSDVKDQVKQLQDVYQDLLQNSEKLKILIKSQIKTYSVNDLEMPSFQFDTKRPTVDLKINVGEKALAGVGTVTMSEVDVDLFNRRLTLQLQVPVITIEGHHSTIGKVKSTTSVAANDNIFKLQAKGVKITATAKLDLGEHLVANDWRFSTSFIVAKGQFGEMEGVDVVIKSALSKALAEDLVKAAASQIEQRVLETIKPKLDKILTKVNHCSLAECKLQQTIHPIYVKEKTTNINAIVDEVLTVVSSTMANNGMDPMELPDIGIEWGISIFKLKVGLFNGFAEGLSNLARAGDWNLHMNGLTKYSIDGSVAIFNLGGQYTWITKYMGIGADADFIADLAYLDITIDIAIDLLNCSMTMNTFDIGDVAPVDITVDGFFLVDWIVEPITQFFTNVFLGVAVNIVENVVQNAIDEILASIDICGKVLPDVIQQVAAPNVQIRP